MSFNTEVLSNIHSEEIHLTLNNTSKIDGVIKLASAIKELISKGETALEIHPNLYQNKSSKVIDHLQSEFSCTVRRGFSEGCYGARSGSRKDGFVVFISLVEFPDSIIDTESNTEAFNPLSLLNEFATSVSETTDEAVELLVDGLDNVTHDNTSNYESNLMSVIDFKILHSGPDYSGKTLIAFRIHCGGDIRGNYSSYYLASFTEYGDMMQVFYPYSELNENN